VEVIPHMDISRRLDQILRSQDPGSKSIIFCSTKRMCDQLARNLRGCYCVLILETFIMTMYKILSLISTR
jgi:superfamily II DNA/RNA helicase